MQLLFTLLIWVLSIASGLLILVFLFWKIYFLREPARQIPAGKSITSPACGKIIKIMSFGSKDRVDLDKGLIGKIVNATDGFEGEGWIIVIFMSPLDVHVQRAPIDGRIVSAKYTKGSFKSAVNIVPENEKNEIIIEGNPAGRKGKAKSAIRVKVIQVAGLVARRIECFVKKGENVIKGERIGRINLGSQVIVVLPKDATIKAKVGQRVRDGETVLAEM
jgi:phosphatidylserine decarboxylase